MLTAALAELGKAGADWMHGLPELVAGLAADWQMTVGKAMSGGNTSYVAEAVTHDGTQAVLKVALPKGIVGFVPFEQQVKALSLVGGDPYVRLLRHDPSRNAFLLERLGPPLADLGWPVARQLETLVRIAARGWRPVAPDQFPTEADRARFMGDYIASVWEEQGQPCPENVAGQAIAYAKERAAKFEPSRALLLHGDAHPFNLLKLPGGTDDFRLIDPLGIAGQPAVELGVILRNLNDNLANQEPAEAKTTMKRHCEQAAQQAATEPEAVWQWAIIERVADGLHKHKVGEQEEANRILSGITKLFQN